MTDRDELLAENRRNREAARTEAQEKAAKKRLADRLPGRVDDEEQQRRGPSLTALLAVLAAILAVTTIVFGVLAFRGGDSLGPESGIGEQAVTDAKKYAVDIVTYDAGDYAALDKRIRDFSTPAFAKRYIDSSQEARRGNDEAKASSTAKAVAAGLQSISETQAVVLVALDQKVTSPDLPVAGEDGIDYRTRVLISLQRDGDRWLVSDLEMV